MRLTATGVLVGARCQSSYAESYLGGVRVLHGDSSPLDRNATSRARTFRCGLETLASAIDLHKLVHWQGLHEESRRELGQPSTRHCDNDFMARRLH